MLNTKTKISLFGMCIAIFFCRVCLNVGRSMVFAQEKIVAIVNDDVITQKDVDDFMNFMRIQMSNGYNDEQLESKIQSMKSDLLERLIEDRLIISEAKKNNIKIEESRIKAKMEEIRKHYSSDEEFQASLKHQGMVRADLEAKAREQLLMYTIVDSKIRSKIVVNPSEVTDFYQKHIEDFKLSQVWEFDVLTTADKSKAFEISEKFKLGRNFNDIAGKYSLTPSKLNVKKGELKKDVEDILLALKPKQISEPIEIEKKYYIFRLNNTILPRQQSLSEAQDTVYSFLYNKKMQETLTKWLDELRARSYIKIVSPVR